MEIVAQRTKFYLDRYGSEEITIEMPMPQLFESAQKVNDYVKNLVESSPDYIDVEKKSKEFDELVTAEEKIFHEKHKEVIEYIQNFLCCAGEPSWDKFPDSRKLGRAPEFLKNLKTLWKKEQEFYVDKELADHLCIDCAFTQKDEKKLEKLSKSNKPEKMQSKRMLLQKKEFAQKIASFVKDGGLAICGELKCYAKETDSSSLCEKIKSDFVSDMEFFNSKLVGSVCQKTLNALCKEESAKDVVEEYIAKRLEYDPDCEYQKLVCPQLPYAEAFDRNMIGPLGKIVRERNRKSVETNLQKIVENSEKKK